MRIPLLLAHGQGLASYMFIALAAGAVGLLSLFAAVISFVSQPRGNRRVARGFSITFIACVVLIFIAPLFINLFHLP